MLRQTALVREAASTDGATERLEAEVTLGVGAQSLSRLEALVADVTREGDVGAMHELVGVESRVRLERLVTSLAGEDTRVAVDHVVGVQVALVHESVAADIAHESRPVGRVAPAVGPQQHRRLVVLVAGVAFVRLAVDVRCFVHEQRAVRHEPLAADATEERSGSRVQHHVHLKTVVVREGLVTDGTLEPARLAVQRLHMILEM